MEFVKKRIDNDRFINLVLTVLVLALIPSTIVASSWKWIAFGDTRNNKPEHRKVLEAIVTNSPDYKFLFNVGDVVDHGDIESEWSDWYNTTIEVLGDLGQDQFPPKYMATPGNHDATETEQGLANWNKYLPGQVQQFGHEGKFFTFDYENARFIVLDSDKSSKSGEQYTMLLGAIQNNPNTWLFVITHRPIFAFGNYEYQDEMHDLWGIPLYQNGCDILFVGHDHFYLRTKKLALNGDPHPPLDSLNGTIQVVCGNGGASLRDIFPDKDGNGYMVEKYIKANGYTELLVEDDTLRLRHILLDGSVFDELILTPNPKTVASSFKPNHGGEYLSIPFLLQQNYPNPFNPVTHIQFTIPNGTNVNITVFDVNGRIVNTIFNDYLEAGSHQIRWECTVSNGNRLPTGIYFYKLQAGKFSQTKKMIVTN